MAAACRGVIFTNGSGGDFHGRPLGPLSINGNAETPRKTRLWVRVPNWLGDVVMVVPILRAIRRGRPDFEITCDASKTRCRRRYRLRCTAVRPRGTIACRFAQLLAAAG